MPGCSTCGRSWPEHFQRCPEDGTSLTGQPVGSLSGNAAVAYAESQSEDLPAGSLAGEYRIEKKIGEGGMGSVYGAKHPLIGKRAAIKVIRRELSNSREAVDRFVLEAQSVNQIGHPNIVDVFGFGNLPDGRAFFVMEWLEGESLRDRLQRQLQFPEALEMLEAIAKALQAAHDAGVVHRDLKPDNVFLQLRKGEKAIVKLLDFGLAKLTNRGGGEGFNQTRTGVVMGTPLYLSPEQAKGAKIDAGTDVYSLGAMAYEMLSGVVPFKADSAVEIMAMHISQAANPVVNMAPWVPPEINALIMQMLEKDPQRRPTTAEVRERIAACRGRASVATIGLAINPSAQGPAWTPNGMHTPPPGMHTPPHGVHTPPQAMHTPGPGMYTPPTGMPYAGSGSLPPGQLSASSVGQSAMSQPQPSGSKKIFLIIGLLVLVGAGVAVALVANKQPAQVASKDPATDPNPAKVDMTTVPAAGSNEPVKTEPAAGSNEPAPTGSNTEPVKTEPVKTEPADPVKKPVEAPRRGKVNVTFVGPARAMIIIDGKPQGRETGGHVTLELPVGEHTVRVQSKGYKPAEAKVRIDAGGSRDLKLTLEKKQNVNAVHDPFAD